MAKMKFKPADDAKDTLWGPLGTPERDAMEAQLKEEIHAYLAVEANNSHNACPPPTTAEDLSTK